MCRHRSACRLSIALTIGILDEGSQRCRSLKQFIEAGGTLHRRRRLDPLLWSAAWPGGVRSALVDVVEWRHRRCRRTRQHDDIPALRCVSFRVDNTTPLGFGFEPEVDVFFDNSPVFRVGFERHGVARRGYDARRLRSGWARGQRHLSTEARSSMRPSAVAACCRSALRWPSVHSRTPPSSSSSTRSTTRRRNRSAVRLGRRVARAIRW